MSESNKLNTEEIVKQNSVSCPGISSKYWDDFPEDFVLYIETSYDIQENQLIAHNLDEIQKIYAAHNLNFCIYPYCYRMEPMFSGVFIPVRNSTAQFVRKI